jgi:hypothetical protein
LHTVTTHRKRHRRCRWDFGDFLRSLPGKEIHREWQRALHCKVCTSGDESDEKDCNPWDKHLPLEPGGTLFLLPWTLGAETLCGREFSLLGGGRWGRRVFHI